MAGQRFTCMRIALAALLLVTLSCGEPASIDQTTMPAPSSTVTMTTTEAVTTIPTTTEVVPTTLLPEPDPMSGEAWPGSEAERDVSNYLAALAAGAYQQAAWSAENAGAATAQAETLERLCAGGVCAGPYTVDADGAVVTVTHVESEVIRLLTFEGQKVIADLPPLVPSAGGPSLVEELFGNDLPSRVVVARFKAFEIWENGESEWVTNWFSDETHQVEGEVLGGTLLANLRDPRTTYDSDCFPRLVVRDAEVLAVTQCDVEEWRIFEVTTGESRDAPIPFEQRVDGEFVWFTERGGTVIHRIGDAEGAFGTMITLDGRQLFDDYAGFVVLSTDGTRLAYTDHRDPASYSHWHTPVVVVVDVATGAELDRWTLDNAVSGIEFSESWLVVGEADPATLSSGIPEQIALTAINVDTGEIRRALTRTNVFLPT